MMTHRTLSPAHALPFHMALLLLVVCAPVLTRAAEDSAAAGAPERVMLPGDVTPEAYRIDVTPDAAALTFKGSVQIDLAVHAPTRQIVFNSADIVIDSATLTGAAVAGISYDAAAQTASVTLERVVPPGSTTLTLVYHGKIFQQASGLFALDYQTPHGKARALFTQFENSDARRFVPCWDEPGRKATFQLTVTVPKEQMALSNMPIAASETVEAGLKRVHFAATPKMSSYLLFFGAGDFERVHRDVDGVDLGVVVKRGDTAAGAFALDAAQRILPYYNAYFGTPYPLPKLDLIAAPGSSQFFGAMENWGAIFFFERDLLIEPRISTQHDRQAVYTTVAHEMAHQWFGDLVTMAWWDDLWLNEGFASWMENKVTDHFHPEWKIWLQSQNETQFAMAEDARDGTHPIITPILDVLEASGAFDAITYLKGAAVIRMLEAYLGENAFRDGVRRYMHDHAYGNTVTDDLWNAMDQGSARPIKQIARDFTRQAGVPMIVERSAACSGGRSQLQLMQSRFAIDDSTAASTWHVPVLTGSPGGTPVSAVIAGASPQGVAVDGCAPVIINEGQAGYYRVHYTSAAQAAVTARYAGLASADQLGLLDDSSALGFAGILPMAAVLDIAAHFPADADPIVATALVGLLEQLDRLYDGMPAQSEFRAFALRWVRPLFARIGWDKRAGESDNVALLRSSLIGALSEFEDPAVIDEARRRFAASTQDGGPMEPGLRRAVLKVVAVHADQATWDRLHQLARSATSELERQQYYNLLGAPENEALVRQALGIALAGEPPPTLVPEILDAAAERHPALAFDFAVAHWDTLSAHLEPDSQARFVPSLLGDASDPALIDRLQAFADLHIPAGARQDVRKVESHIRYLAAVRRDRLPEVGAWLAARHRSARSSAAPGPRGG